MVLLKRKSGFEDAFFVIVVILTLSLFLLVVGKAWSEMKDPLETSLSESMPSDPNVNITKNFEIVTDTITLISNLLPLVIIGLFAFVFIGIGLYFNHPLTIFIGIIVLSVAILVAVIFANIYHEIANTDAFSEQNDIMVIQGKFMNYLPTLILVLFIGIIGAIIYLKKGGTSSL